MASVISSKINSLRSHGSSNRSQNTSSAINTFSAQNPFRFRQQNDSVWDGDSSYGMLRLERDCEKDAIQAVHQPAGGSGSEDDLDARNGGVFGGKWGNRKAGATRLPTLEIVKSQSVNQEITYLDPQRSRTICPTTWTRGETFGNR
jgi:hypothetical protein